MNGCCLTCGQFDGLEGHHVAGRHNHELVVAVCVDCHRILSRWQLAAGMELQKEAARSELDGTRALVVGSVHLLQLFAQRHRDRSWVSAELWTHTARAVSRLFDSCGPADRQGRWLPDPTVPPVEAAPVGWSEPAEVECTREFGHFVVALARILGDVPPLSVDVLTDIATDAPRYVTAFARPAGDGQATAEILRLVQAHLEASTDLVRHLLTLEDLSRVDATLIHAAHAWSRTTQRLLEQSLALARSGESEAPS